MSLSDKITSSRTYAIPAAFAALVVSTLVGCAPEPDDTNVFIAPFPSPTSQTPTASPMPTVTATAATIADGAVPISTECDVILSPQALAKTQPGLELVSGFNPKDGSFAEQIKEFKGVACQWKDSNSGNTITFAASHLGSQKLTAINKGLVQTSKQAAELSDSNSVGYFSYTNGVGEAQVITNKYWLVLYSANFDSATRAAPLVSMSRLALEWADKN